MKRLLLAAMSVVVVVGSVFADDSPQSFSVRYWFDDGDTAAVVSESPEFDADCSSLATGLHTLRYVVTDGNGNRSAVREHSFIKIAPANAAQSVTTLQYWWDDMHANAITTPYSSDAFAVSADTLHTGLHSLKYRVMDDKGKWSGLKIHQFYKGEVVDTTQSVTTLQYWWDDMHANAITAPYSSDVFTVSADALPYGLHSLKYRVKDDKERWSGLKTHYFYKGEELDSALIVGYTYWWNDLHDSAVTKVLETPAKTFELVENIQVPEEAHMNYVDHYKERLNLVMTDNHGRNTYLYSDVERPDSDAPKTDIDADSYSVSTEVTLTWTESTGDRMGDYNVYVSKDGGPFLLWLPDTQLTTSVFRGEGGSRYVFTVTGRDAFGNREKYDESKCVSVTFE